MPAAHFLGLRPRLVFAQYPDDLLLAEATPFHRPSPFSGDGLYLISAEFSGCRPHVVAKISDRRSGGDGKGRHGDAAMAAALAFFATRAEPGRIGYIAARRARDHFEARGDPFGAAPVEDVEVGKLRGF